MRVFGTLRSASFHFIGAFAAVTSLESCVYVNEPIDASTHTNPVAFDVTWSANMKKGTFGARLVRGSTSTMITSLFTVDYSSRRATASLTLAPDSYQIVAGGDVWNFLWQQYAYNGQSHSFTVTGSAPPALSISGPAVILAGGNGTFTVSRGAASTSGALTVNLASSNIAVATLPSSVTIPVGSSSATVNVNGVAAGTATVMSVTSGFVFASASLGVDPVLSSLSPTIGLPGMSVTVTGIGFVTPATARFGTANASTSFVSSTQLSATVPSGVGGTVSVTVLTGGRTSNAQSFTVPALTLSGPSTIVAGASPAFTVSRGTAPASSGLTVNLSSNAAAATVQFSVTIPAGNASTAVNVNGTQAGSATITASASGFLSGTATVDVDPVLSSLSPTSGVPGTTVTLTGGGFVSPATARFGAVSATTSFVSSTQLTATVPSGVTGTVSVTVQTGGRTSNAQSFSVPTLSLLGPSTLVAGTSPSFTVSRGTAPTSSSLTVNLISSNTAVATAPSSVTIPVGNTSTSFNVSGVAAGNTTITASASGFLSATGSVNVDPVISSLSPTSGVAGSTVTVVGVGFVSPATVRFGAASASTSFVSSTQVTATVPSSVPTGPVSVTVVMAARTSNAQSFIVTLPQIVIRASNIDVQSFDYSNPSNPALVSTQSGTPSAGGYAPVIGLSYNGSGFVVRATTSNVQAYSVGPTGTLGAPSSATASPSPTSVAVWASGSTVVRGSDGGIQTFSLTGGVLSAQGQTGGASSVTGVGVDGQGGILVRATNAGLQLYDISILGSPALRSTAGGAASTTGVGVKLYAGGTRAVRGYNAGVEVYSVTATTVQNIGVRTGTPSATGVAVATNGAGTIVVRAYNGGIEVYNVTNPASIQFLGSHPGVGSATGTAVALLGNRVWRASERSIEEYDITNPASIVLVTTVQATISTTGVGIAVRP